MAENSKLRISLTRFSCKQIYEQPAHRNFETFHIKKELRKKIPVQRNLSFLHPQHRAPPSFETNDSARPPPTSSQA